MFRAGFVRLRGMKKQSFLILIAAALVFSSAQATVYIMPLGDSVTARGSNPESSYRYWLYQSLVTQGLSDPADFQFIGSQNGVSDGSPANSDFDQHYEGGPSGADAWTTVDAINRLSFISNEGADIVLLDLGANDVIAGTDLGTITTNLETIIEGFTSVNPNVVILLADPTGWQTSDPIERKNMTRLASAVNKAAAHERSLGARIKTVNLFGGYSPLRDTKDGTHPNVQGEKKIAKKFYGAVKGALKKYFGVR